MKRRLFYFLLPVLAGLLLLPVINLTSSVGMTDKNWWKIKQLYNADLILRLLSENLSPLGISTAPNEVVIGQDGWLFLGDRYERTLSTDRLPASMEDQANSTLSALNLSSWRDYLRSRKVAQFKVMLGPNKSSIYPEYMPAWARPDPKNATNAFSFAADPDIVIDLRPILLDAKQNSPAELYFKTDTHWNVLGAGVAFKKFISRLASEDGILNTPSPSTYDLLGQKPRPSGDLTNFLHLHDPLGDIEPAVQILRLYGQSSIFSYDTGALLDSKVNPLIDAPHQPIVVVNKSALNDKKVIWLRDSFGTAMSPFMSFTFSHVTQLHWLEAMKDGGSQLLQMIEKVKPDYVFITVVERSVRNPVFLSAPPRP